MGFPKKILIVTESFGVGGLETQIAGQCESLALEGVETHLATWSPPGSPLDRFEGRRLRLPGLSLPMTAGDFVDRVDAIAAYARDRGVDHIHAHPFLSSFPAVCAAASAGLPVSMTLHGPASVEAENCYGFNHRWFHHRAVFRFCHRIFAVSEEIAALAARHTTPERIVVLPNGVDPVGHPEAVRNDEARARWAVVARLDSDKSPGVAAFVRTALDAGVKQVEILGDGDRREELTALFAGEVLSGSVVFRGMSDSPVNEIREGYSGVGAMGRAFLEAASTGLPVCLVGYAGSCGLMDSDRFKRAAGTNFSGRGMPVGSHEDFSRDLDVLSGDPRRFDVRDTLLAAHSAPVIWRRYLEETADSPEACRMPRAFLEWLRTLPRDTDMLESHDVALALDDILAENGFPPSPRDERLLVERRIQMELKSIREILMDKKSEGIPGEGIAPAVGSESSLSGDGPRGVPSSTKPQDSREPAPGGRIFRRLRQLWNYLFRGRSR